MRAESTGERLETLPLALLGTALTANRSAIEVCAWRRKYILQIYAVFAAALRTNRVHIVLKDFKPLAFVFQIELTQHNNSPFWVSVFSA